MSQLVVIDNYDSFVYNLVHYLEELGCSVSVVRNDQLTLDQVAPYDKILLSPGPGIPDEAGILKPIIETYAATKSIFGVCLGLQAIGEVFGGKLHNLDKVYHGIATQATCIDDKAPVFQGISAEFTIGRYHSWVIAQEGLPEDLIVTALDDQNRIMALRHKTLNVRGVQFHPESVLTPDGKKMLQNWINL